MSEAWCRRRRRGRVEQPSEYVVGPMAGVPQGQPGRKGKKVPDHARRTMSQESRYVNTKSTAQAAKLVSQALLRPLIEQMALQWMMITLVAQRNIVSQV